MNIKMGLIGTGNIIESHIKSINTTKDIEITCICDHNKQKLEHALNLLTNAKGFSDYSQMLNEDLDIVLVSLPHGLHCKVTIDVLKSGCHVMVEKPMAISVNECNQMLLCAKDEKKFLFVTESSSFIPGVIRTGEKFKNGFLGRFFTGSIVNERYYFHEGRPEWFFNPVMSGGGMFSNIGLHRLAVARGCLPGLVPESVCASVSYMPEYQIEACTSAIVKYKQGGSFMYEEVGYFPKPEWLNTGTHLIFEKGIVMWDQNTWRLMTREGDEITEELIADDSVYDGVYRNLIKAIKGEAFIPTAYEYALDVAIAQGVYASAKEGREIKFNEPDWIVVR